MRAIVPLAGPDFELPDGSTKAETIIDGKPLLRAALESRSWWKRRELSAGDICFVLRDRPISRRFCSDVLITWYPGAKVVFLSSETEGAAMSAVAGVAMTHRVGPLCLDLADIIYEDDFRPEQAFADNRRLGGVALTFQATSSAYSYLRLDKDGLVVEAAEKRVISPQASAGTYFFRDVAGLLEATIHGIRNFEQQNYAGRLFICPLFNGVIASGWAVGTSGVRNVIDIKRSGRFDQDIADGIKTR